MNSKNEVKTLARKGIDESILMSDEPNLGSYLLQIIIQIIGTSIMCIVIEFVAGLVRDTKKDKKDKNIHEIKKVLSLWIK